MLDPPFEWTYFASTVATSCRRWSVTLWGSTFFAISVVATPWRKETCSRSASVLDPGVDDRLRARTCSESTAAPGLGVLAEDERHGPLVFRAVAVSKEGEAQTFGDRDVPDAVLGLRRDEAARSY